MPKHKAITGEKLMSVDTGFANVLIGVTGNKIVDVPPIFKGWQDRAFSTFLAYYKPKVQEVNRSVEPICANSGQCHCGPDKDPEAA